MLECSHCGRENPNASRFCMACGRPIEARAGAPAGLSPGSPGDAPGEVDARGFEMAAPPGEYAGFWIRFGAYLLDGFFLELFALVLGFVIGFFMGELGVGEKAGIVGALAGLALGFGYFTYYFGSSGQTWGKRICGLRVVRVDGGRLGYGRAFARVLGYNLSFLLLGHRLPGGRLHPPLAGAARQTCRVLCNTGALSCLLGAAPIGPGPRICRDLPSVPSGIRPRAFLSVVNPPAGYLRARAMEVGDRGVCPGGVFHPLGNSLGRGGFGPIGGGEIQLNGPPVKAGDWYHLFLVSFVVVGPIEELCKYAAVRFSVYRSAEFNEPLDGLVYSSAAALDFASLENVFFTIQNGPAVMLVRAPLSTLGHVFFAAMWGYSLGVHRLGIARRGTVGRGLFASMFLHGLFNFVLLTQTVLALAVLPLMAVAGRMTWRRIKEYQRISPFRERRPERLVRCPSCGGFIEETSAFCNFCGARVEFVPENVRLHCGHCRKAVVPEARFCNACGHSLMPDPGGPGPA